MENKLTLENVKTIQNLIEPMKNNPKFAKLILYSLSTIKSIISLHEKQSIEAFSKMLLTNDIFETLKLIFNTNIDNEEILTKIGELMFCLVKLKQHEKKALLNSSSELISKNDIFAYVLEFLSMLKEEYIESHQIFIKVLQSLSSDSEISNASSLENSGSSSNLHSVFSVTLNLLSKMNNNQSIVLYLIETLKKVFLHEGFNVNTEHQIQLVSEINKIVNNMENYQSYSVIRECFQLLRLVFHKHSEAKECYKKSKPISLILKVMTLSSNQDQSLGFYCIQLLADIIDKKDIELLLRFLKESSYLESRKGSTLKITVNVNDEKSGSESFDLSKQKEKEQEKSNPQQTTTTENTSSAYSELEKERVLIGILREFQNPVSNEIIEYSTLEGFPNDDLNNNLLANNKESNEADVSGKNNKTSDNNKEGEGEETLQSTITENKESLLENKGEKGEKTDFEGSKDTKKDKFTITPELILFLRKSIAKVLITIAKDPTLLKILGELNSMETLVEIILQELENKQIVDESKDTCNLEQKEGKNNDLIESILPNFLKLAFTLLSEFESKFSIASKQYDSLNNTNDNKALIEKIGFCLVRALVLLRNNPVSVNEIIEILLSTKNKVLLESMAKDFLKNFKSVYFLNYEEPKVALLISKMSSVIQNLKRYEEVSSKNNKNSNEANSKINLIMKNLVASTLTKTGYSSSHDNIVDYEDLAKELKENLIVIEKTIENFKTRSYSIIQEVESSEEINVIETETETITTTSIFRSRENTVNTESLNIKDNNNNNNNSNESQLKSKPNLHAKTRPSNININDSSNIPFTSNSNNNNNCFNNANNNPFHIPANSELNATVKSIKSILLSISYGMLFENNFPENLFHETCLFSKSLLSLLSSEIKIENFSADSDLVKIYNNFLIVCLVNSKFGLVEEKISMFSAFLGYVMMEPGLNLFNHHFIIKQIDFFLLPENKGYCKTIINNSSVISFITSAMREYIKESNQGFCSQTNHFRPNNTSNSQTNNNNNCNNNNNSSSTALGIKRGDSKIMTKSSGIKRGSTVMSIDFDVNSANNNDFLGSKATKVSNNTNNTQESNLKVLEVELLDFLLKSITTLLKHNTITSYTQFIRENGVVMVIELCGIKVLDFESNKLIIKLLQRFSNDSLFKVATQYFKNYLYSSKLVSSLNEINFSKGINEKIYMEILVFFKNIYKNCDIIEAIEEKHIIEHLLIELDQIYCFYMDTNNKVFELILELLSSFSKEKRLKRQLINSTLFLKVRQILRTVFSSTSGTLGGNSQLSNLQFSSTTANSITNNNSDNNLFSASSVLSNPPQDELEFNEKVIDYLCIIFINFLKSKEYSRMLYDTYYSVLELVKVIALKINVSENTLSKLITVFQYIIDLEKQTVLVGSKGEGLNFNNTGKSSKLNESHLEDSNSIRKNNAFNNEEEERGGEGNTYDAPSSLLIKESPEIIEYLNSTVVLSTNNKLITPTFLTELLNKISSESKSLRSTITKCIGILVNDAENKNNNNNNNNNINNRSTGKEGGDSGNEQAKETTGGISTFNDIMFSRKNTKTCSALTEILYKSTSSVFSAVNKLTTDQVEAILKDIPILFETICQDILFLLETVFDQDISYNREYESEQLISKLNDLSKLSDIISTLNSNSKHVKVVKGKTTIEEFIQQIYDLGIIDKIIILLANKESQLSIVLNGAFSFLIKMEETNKELFYRNEKLMDFFLSTYKRNFEEVIMLEEGSKFGDGSTGLNSVLVSKKLQITLNFIDYINIELALSQNKHALYDLLNVNITAFSEKEKAVIEDFFEKTRNFTERIVTSGYYLNSTSKAITLISSSGSNNNNNNTLNNNSNYSIRNSNSNFQVNPFVSANSLFNVLFGASVKSFTELIMIFMLRFKHHTFSRFSKIPRFIFNIVEFISKEELFVKELLTQGFLERINEYLYSIKSIKNEDEEDQLNMYYCLRMLEVFSTHKFFAIKIIEQTTITNINNIIELCLLISLENKSKNANNNTNNSTANNNNSSSKQDSKTPLKLFDNNNAKRSSKSDEEALKLNEKKEDMCFVDPIGGTIVIALRILITTARHERKFSTIMGIYGVKETTMSIITYNNSTILYDEMTPTSSNTNPNSYNNNNNNNNVTSTLNIITQNNSNCKPNANYFVREYILLSLELLFLMISDDYNIVFFRDPLHIQLIIDFLKSNIKDKNITCLILKIINLLIQNFKTKELQETTQNSIKVIDTTLDSEMKQSLKTIKTLKTNNTNELQGDNNNKHSTAFNNNANSNINSKENPLKEALEPGKMIEIINDLLDLYSTNYEITYQTCELISKFLNINEDQVIKDFLVSIIVNNFDRYSSKQEIIEMFLNSILTMLRQVRQLQHQSKNHNTYDPSSIVFFVSKIAGSSELKVNDGLLIPIFKIIKQVARYSNLATSLVNEMFIITKLVESRPSLHNDDELIVLFSKLFKLVCQANASELGTGHIGLQQQQQPSIKMSHVENSSSSNKKSMLVTGGEGLINTTGKHSNLIIPSENRHSGIINSLNPMVTIVDEPFRYLFFLLKQINKSLVNYLSSSLNNSTTSNHICFQLLEDYKYIIMYFSLTACEEQQLEAFCEQLFIVYAKSTNSKITITSLSSMTTNKNTNKEDKEGIDENTNIGNKIISTSNTNNNNISNIINNSNTTVKKDSNSKDKDNEGKSHLYNNAYNPKLVTLILEIISFLSLHNENIKEKLLEYKLNTHIEEFIENLGRNVDPLLEYQAKGTIVSLKKKKNQFGDSVVSKMTTNNNNNNNNNSRLSTISIQDTSFLFPTLKDDVKKYLKEERKVKLYTEKGDIKDRFIMFNEGLDQIIAIKRDGQKFEIFDTMNIKEMDRCLRSCTTSAFTNSKGLFTRKPNAKNCFSILGIKSLKGQKTFNIECAKEEDCIKYVDHISMLIQSFKSMGMNESNYSIETVKTEPIKKNDY